MRGPVIDGHRPRVSLPTTQESSAVVDDGVEQNAGEGVHDAEQEVEDATDGEDCDG